jgi:mono/diheme cytochrome c family protein
VVKNGPVLPHRIAPGESDQIEVAMNLAGKSGTVVKAVVVDTSAGTKTLLLRVEIPAASSTNSFVVPGGTAAVDADARRAAGMAAAAADRQAIFKGDCAKCHVEPATGKEGRELYAASCGICHDAEHRASMVPDLKALPHPTSPEFWQAMITEGKPGTLMPAFSEKNGGNLTDIQIASLVKHLSRTIPANPTSPKAASAP